MWIAGFDFTQDQQSTYIFHDDVSIKEIGLTNQTSVFWLAASPGLVCDTNTIPLFGLIENSLCSYFPHINCNEIVQLIFNKLVYTFNSVINKETTFNEKYILDFTKTLNTFFKNIALSYMLKT